MNYFEAKVKYTNQDEKVVKENYLVDAVSLTEMEARTIKELGEVQVIAGKESNISAVYRNGNGDRLFKAKVVYLDVVDGKEKKIIEYNLIESDTVENASTKMKEKLADSIVPFEIPSVSESNIIDVFNYFEE